MITVLKGHRLLILCFSIILVGLSIPASSASGLQTNDDSLCLLAAVPFFGFSSIVSLLPIRRYGHLLRAGSFVAAAALQGWALHWIEGMPLGQLIREASNPALVAWLVAYGAAVVAILVMTVLKLKGRTSAT